VSFNPYMQEITGYTIDEVKGKDWFKTFLPQYDHDIIRNLFKKALSKTRTQGNVNSILTKSGGSLDIEWYDETLKDEEENITGLLCIGYDITKHITLQEQLKEINARHNIALKAANIGPWDWDLKTNEVYFSPEWKAQIGYNDDEIQNNYTEWESRLHPEDKKGVLDAIAAHLEGRTNDYEVQFRLRHKDGSYLWIHCKGEALKDDQNKYHRMLGCHVDITEQKKTNEWIRQSEKLEAVGQLASGVAHDFNNQLGGIIGFADLLANKLKDPKLNSYAVHIRNAARYAEKLTRQLLTFSRKTQSEIEPVDLKEVIMEVVDLLKHVINRQITISQNLNAPSHITMGDPAQLQNAILNIAINARDAITGNGEICIGSDVVVFNKPRSGDTLIDITPGTFLKISISDTGCGIDHPTLKRIFEPFFTTKAPGKGTGMGLASVYTIIKNHDGTLEVKSQVNKGSTFDLYLPLSQAKYQTSTKEKQLSAAAPSRIMIIDDEKIVREIGAEILKDLGHSVTAFNDGAEALREYKTDPKGFDLVILDMVMPLMSGQEVFAAIQKINPDARIMLTSGFGLNTDVSALLDQGAVGFIAKPFLLSELAETVAGALNRQP
ncbi:MAG: PAS domain-containing protein, partial [Deltaproteobacteria bacterium]|nr:PAS domain-containing protein [Deltaproteobacteria bacterium]